MNLVERSFRLEADEGLGGKPRPELIGPILTHLHDTLQDSVRMGFLHSSRARGRVPAALKSAADVRYLGHSADGDNATLLRFEVAPFGEAAEELFKQQVLWAEGPQPEQTAFELLGSALCDVAGHRVDSNRFDPALLRRIASYRRMFGRGRLQRIALPDTVLPQAGQLDLSVASAARELSDATPSSQRVRITGRLDLMGASQGVLKLHLQPGAVVTAIWEGDTPLETLTSFFNRDVVIEGLAVFRPSGSLLRVDADAIAAANANDEFFRHLPTGTLTRDFAKLAQLRSGEKSVYERILGSIPGEESDEEFAAAVEALS